MNKLWFTCLLLFLLTGKVSSQVSWHYLVEHPDDSTGYFDIAKQFCKDHNITWPGKDKIDSKFIGSIADSENEEDGDAEHFKRWARFWMKRVNADGKFPPAGYLSKVRQAYKQSDANRRSNEYKTNQRSQGCASGAPPFVWRPSVSRADSSAGRIDCIAINPVNPAVIWAGSPTGGLWMSSDTGHTWTTNTDTLNELGVSAIAISPSNPSVMYIATGDRDCQRLWNTAIYKSADAGQHWQACPCGSVCPVQHNEVINQILIQPSNPDTIYVATSSGFYRSYNGGNTWVQVHLGYNVKNMVFQTNDASVILGAADDLNTGAFEVRVTNYGNSYVVDTVGLQFNSSLISNARIAVTPADPAYVYMLVTSSAAFYGLFLSTDTGHTFSLQSDSPNIMSPECPAPVNGNGQAWYDLAFTVSPVNKNVLYAGGVNMWCSQDAGITWRNLKCGGGTLDALHADQHYFLWSANAQTLYVGNDGGIWKSTNNGSSWNNITSNIQTTQYYCVSSSFQHPDVFIAGTQDNGIYRYSGGTWQQIYIADVPACVMNYANDSFYYFAVGGAFGAAWTGINVTQGPIAFDPDTPAVLINLNLNVFYKSHDYGQTWSAVSNTIAGLSTDMQGVWVSKQNENVYYAYRTWDSIFKIDLRTSLARVIQPPALAVNWDQYLGGLEVSNLDSNTLWAWYGGLASNNPIIATYIVFKSSDGGNTWVDISSGLPAVHASTLVHDQRTTSDLYLGTDVGVFYYNDSIGQWINFSDSLPNVIINELEIVYPFNILRAATYGRGVWQCNLAANPVAAIAGTEQTICAGQTVVWRDSSANNPNTWLWNFQGGTPAISDSQNVSVTYMQPGTYAVSLQVTNSAGCDSINVLSAVMVDSFPSAAIYRSGDSLIALYQAYSYQWTLNGNSLPGDTGNVLALPANIKQSACYQLIARDKFGCESVSDSVCFSAGPLSVSDREVPDIRVYPNPATTHVMLEFDASPNERMPVQITDMYGQIIYSNTLAQGVSTIDISSWAQAIYIISCKNSNGSFSQKLIKSE